MRETLDVGWVPGLGTSPGGANGNPLRILTWKIPWTEEPGELWHPWVCQESDTIKHVRAYTHTYRHTLSYISSNL